MLSPTSATHRLTDEANLTQTRISNLFATLEKESEKSENDALQSQRVMLDNLMGHYFENNSERQQEICSLLDVLNSGLFSHHHLEQLIKTDHDRSHFILKMASGLKRQLEVLFTSFGSILEDANNRTSSASSINPNLLNNMYSNINLIMDSVSSLSAAAAAPAGNLDFLIKSANANIVTKVDSVLADAIRLSPTNRNAKNKDGLFVIPPALLDKYNSSNNNSTNSSHFQSNSTDDLRSRGSSLSRQGIRSGSSHAKERPRETAELSGLSGSIIDLESDSYRGQRGRSAKAPEGDATQLTVTINDSAYVTSSVNDSLNIDSVNNLVVKDSGLKVSKDTNDKSIKRSANNIANKDGGNNSSNVSSSKLDSDIDGTIKRITSPLSESRIANKALSGAVKIDKEEDNNLAMGEVGLEKYQGVEGGDYTTVAPSMTADLGIHPDRATNSISMPSSGKQTSNDGIVKAMKEKQDALREKERIQKMLNDRENALNKREMALDEEVKIRTRDRVKAMQDTINYLISSTGKSLPAEHQQSLNRHSTPPHQRHNNNNSNIYAKKNISSNEQGDDIIDDTMSLGSTTSVEALAGPLANKTTSTKRNKSDSQQSGSAHSPDLTLHGTSPKKQSGLPAKSASNTTISAHVTKKRSEATSTSTIIPETIDNSAVIKGGSVSQPGSVAGLLDQENLSQSSLKLSSQAFPAAKFNELLVPPDLAKKPYVPQELYTVFAPSSKRSSSTDTSDFLNYLYESLVKQGEIDPIPQVTTNITNSNTANASTDTKNPQNLTVITEPLNLDTSSFATSFAAALDNAPSAKSALLTGIPQDVLAKYNMKELPIVCDNGILVTRTYNPESTRDFKDILANDENPLLRLYKEYKDYIPDLYRARLLRASQGVDSVKSADLSNKLFDEILPNIEKMDIVSNQLLISLTTCEKLSKEMISLVEQRSRNRDHLSGLVQSLKKRIGEVELLKVWVEAQLSEYRSIFEKAKVLGLDAIPNMLKQSKSCYEVYMRYVSCQGRCVESANRLKFIKENGLSNCIEYLKNAENFPDLGGYNNQAPIKGYYSEKDVEILKSYIDELLEEIEEHKETIVELNQEVFNTAQGADKTPGALLFFASLHDPFTLQALQQLSLQMNNLKPFAEASEHIEFTTLRKRLQVCMTCVSTLDKFITTFNNMHKRWLQSRLAVFQERNLTGGDSDSHHVCPLCFHDKRSERSAHSSGHKPSVDGLIASSDSHKHKQRRYIERSASSSALPDIGANAGPAASIIRQLQDQNRQTITRGKSAGSGKGSGRI